MVDSPSRVWYDVAPENQKLVCLLRSDSREDYGPFRASEVDGRSAKDYATGSRQVTSV